MDTFIRMILESDSSQKQYIIEKAIDFSMRYNRLELLYAQSLKDMTSLLSELKVKNAELEKKENELILKNKELLEMQNELRIINEELQDKQTEIDLKITQFQESIRHLEETETRRKELEAVFYKLKVLI